MYEQTILTGRQYFWELNKISFTIFGYLHYFILITKVQLRIKMKRYFYSPQKKDKLNLAHRGPCGATRTCKRVAAHRRGAAHGEEARARRHSYKDTPGL